MEPHAPEPHAPESLAHRLGRLRARSMYRGIREMDLVLRDFAFRELGRLPPADLDAYEALLEEPDDLLWLWVSGARVPPAPHEGLVARLRAGAAGLTRPG